jgi:hypothetical protein
VEPAQHDQVRIRTPLVRPALEICYPSLMIELPRCFSSEGKAEDAMVARLEKHTGAVSLRGAGLLGLRPWCPCGICRRVLIALHVGVFRFVDWSLASSRRIASLQVLSRGSFASGISRTQSSQWCTRHSRYLLFCESLGSYKRIEHL